MPRRGLAAQSYLPVKHAAGEISSDVRLPVVFNSVTDCENAVCLIVRSIHPRKVIGKNADDDRRHQIDVQLQANPAFATQFLDHASGLVG
jgi:hypothetical protein